MKLNNEQLNNIFDYITEYIDEDKWTLIKKVEEDCENKKLIEKLIGYKIRFSTDGEHKNDGQMVEYTFKFKNFEGIVTEISTEMCLMVGFNYHKSETIK